MASPSDVSVKKKNSCQQYSNVWLWLSPTPLRKDVICVSFRTEHLRNEPYKSEVPLITSTLLPVKAEKIYIEIQPKCTKRWKQSSANKQLLEALLLAIKICTGFTRDVRWISNVLAIRKTSLLWGSPLRYLVGLMSPYRTKCIY